MSFRIYILREVWESLKYYRGFLTCVWLVGGVTVIYCLLV